MVGVVIFAGGCGIRMKSTDLPKQFIEVDGIPIIIRTINNFSINDKIDYIVVSCKKEWKQYLSELLIKYHINKVVSIVDGGDTGYKSIHNGLVEINKYISVEDIVLICDGVRPLISQELINRTVEETVIYRNAVPVTQSIDSILESEDGIACKKCYTKNNMYVTQAPQGYYLDDILWAHKQVEEKKMVDPISSSELFIQLGVSIHLIEGERQNIKATTQEDLFYLRSYYYYYHHLRLANEESDSDYINDLLRGSI